MVIGRFKIIPSYIEMPGSILNSIKIAHVCCITVYCKVDMPILLTSL